MTNNPMTHEELQRAKAICAAATAEPWTNRIGIGACDHIVKAERECDAVFIIAAREGWPQAIAEIERLRKLVDLACTLVHIAGASGGMTDRDHAIEADIRREAGI